MSNPYTRRSKGDRQVLVDHEYIPEDSNNDIITTVDIEFNKNVNVRSDPVDANTATSGPVKENNAESPTESVICDITSPIIPQDFGYFTYFVFYLLGVATMAPWNFFITAEDYWMNKFRNTSLNATGDITPLQKKFECDLTLTASISGTIFLILNAIYGHKVSLRWKVLSTLFMILLMFTLTCAFVEVNTDSWQMTFFIITLITVVLINVCAATMGGGIFGIVGLFPSEYMTAVVSGQALCGIITALIYITILMFNTGPSATAFSYFISASVLIVFSIVFYMLMERKPFFQYYVKNERNSDLQPARQLQNNQNIPNDIVVCTPNMKHILSRIYINVITVCILYTTTISVYPSITLLMQSEDYGKGKVWNDVFYKPVVNYLFFNSGDYLGRIVAGIWEKPQDKPHTVLIMVILRIIYIPFFLCSNTSLHQYLPVLVHSDVVFITLMLTFAFTNGYLTNILLIMAPRSVMHYEKEMASSIMVASLSCGMVLGSLYSLIFVQML